MTAMGVPVDRRVDLGAIKDGYGSDKTIVS
jgi:hypothetical protein